MAPGFAGKFPARPGAYASEEGKEGRFVRRNKIFYKKFLFFPGFPLCAGAVLFIIKEIALDRFLAGEADAAKAKMDSIK